jgi:hypothetical protein
VPLVLSATDERLIHAVHALRFPTALDLTLFLGFSEKSLPYIRERLARLSGGDWQRNTYLLRFSRPHLGPGSTEKIYHPGTRGQKLLQTQDYYRPNKLAHLSYSRLTHELMVTRVCVAAHRFASTQPDCTLRDCRLSHTLSRTKPPLAAVPDCFLIIEKEGKRYPLWIEIDNSSEFQVKWKHYGRRRLSFIRSGAFAEAFGVPGVVVAYVVTGPTPEASATRCRTLLGWQMELLKELGLERWAGIFRFVSGQWERLYEVPLFTEPIWRMPDAPDTPVPLFPA